MKTLIVEDHKDVVYVKLNRPKVRNAFHPEMIDELTKVFKNLGKNKNVRAVVLSGEGASFCAGADLEWMRSMAKYSRAENKKDAEKLFTMFETMEKLPAVLIGRAHGHVMGGALGLLAVCDVVVADEKTEFCFSEVKLGLSPAVISAFVKNKVSLTQMSRWFLTAEVFSSPVAKEIGLIHEIAVGVGVEEQTQKWLRQLLANGPEAVKETKKLLRKVSFETSTARLKKVTTSLIAELRVSPEGQEGLRGFLEKRNPSWRIM
jgi:methylglutaconyl-CoA hydratase